MNLSNALAGTQTALLASQFAGGFIRIFDVPEPASPDRAESGNLLGIISVNGTAGAGLHFDSSGPALTKSGSEIWVFKGLAAGTAKSFRIVQPGDTAANDLAALRVDGSIGTPISPGDMTWADLSVSEGLFYTIDAFTYLIQPIQPEGE